MAKIDDYVSTTQSKKNDLKDKDKKVISDDAFAVSDLINSLINKIEHLRVSL